MLAITVFTRSGPIRCRWAYESCGSQDDAGPGENILRPIRSIVWVPVWTLGRPDYWQPWNQRIEPALVFSTRYLDYIDTASGLASASLSPLYLSKPRFSQLPKTTGSIVCKSSGCGINPVVDSIPWVGKNYRCVRLRVSGSTFSYRVLFSSRATWRSRQRCNRFVTPQITGRRFDSALVRVSRDKDKNLGILTHHRRPLTGAATRSIFCCCIVIVQQLFYNPFAACLSRSYTHAQN
jgi:hypothetical protein